MAKKEIGESQVAGTVSLATESLKTNQSKYNKKFVVWADTTAKKIYMIYYSKTFALAPVQTSATSASTKNEYPILKASIDFDANRVTYTKPVTSVVDANRVN